MSMPALTVVPAGAGSGKTHTIQERLGEWVRDGLVAPERIVAVTFTEAAASELRERIQAKLIELGRLDDALKLDQAYISTIHGFGSRLLTEFAFESGSSPRPRLLNDDEQNVLIRQAMARTEKVDAIIGDLRRFGYKYQHGTDTSTEDAFRNDVLNVISVLRALGWDEGNPGYGKQAAEWIQEHYGGTVGAKALNDALHHAVQRLLEAFPESLVNTYPNNRSATESFRSDFSNLHSALIRGTLERDWDLWAKLRKLRLSKRGTELPELYDELGGAVIEAADQLPIHPGPLDQAMLHAESLVDAAQEVLVHYAYAKRDAGLIDYTDMIALANEVLRKRPNVVESLLGRVDCLVVDEFQDTNPLQFVLVWHLKNAGVPTLVVGDMKQAIMGFQGADPRLFGALEDQNSSALEPLKKNWRSQPPIMDFVNALGAQLFSEDYVSLVPQAPVSDLEPLEAIRYPDRPKKQIHAVKATHVATRLEALLGDDTQQVVDRRTGEKRKLRGSDIAILCPTHKMLIDYASALRSRGLEARLEEAGWSASRAVRLARTALDYVANPLDRHAAIFLAVTELGQLSLQEGITQLIASGCIADPLLKSLDSLASEASGRTVYALVADTIATVKLFDVVQTWPNGQQERANLLRLLAETSEFMDSQREALAYGGYHGTGLQTFLAWLDAKVEESDSQPPRAVLDENAIELITWHSSKGREWPIVVVSGLDKTISAKLPNIDIGYPSFDDLSNLLDDAHIEYSPEFAAVETRDKFTAPLEVVERIEAKRLLYVAMTRAREKLIVEWPEWLANSKSESVTHWRLLSEEIGMTVDDAAIRINGHAFNAVVQKGSATLPDDDADAAVEFPYLPVFGRRAIQRSESTLSLTPDSIAPSSLETLTESSADEDLEIFQYGSPWAGDLTVSGAELGVLLHRCFEVLGAKPEAVDSVADLFGLDPQDPNYQSVVQQVTAFETWLRRQFEYTTVNREWPILALQPSGSVLSGTIDLLVSTVDGAWILDHKSDRIVDGVTAFATYRAQLDAYANATVASGTTVVGIGINWIRQGQVVLLRR